MSEYLYLHGFASGPQSRKAQYLCDRFRENHRTLSILDLNQGDFSHLTLTRQIHQTQAAFPNATTPVVLIGSSFGGLTVTWVAEKYPQVERIICLAPAFGFLAHWLPTLTPSELTQWQETGYRPVYHHQEQREIPLHYGFIEDLQQYSEQQLERPVPTLILHGIHDEVIPITASRDYCQARPWAELIELDSDHSLGNVLPQIGQEIQQWLAKKVLANCREAPRSPDREAPG
ncbi:alpha/beta fold hydrolase [Spirulina subsalsa FACHB-351]|uniref:Alpha/beta fold hydrolase n=1 Tax=Spirulina subsalsa FACHB-351 TaxID=234711 RepID=A0ABT3L826_9CYAN|nr:YqiA/YcfP family alpha/beta fold hydrolase [Spirulina subsalsa]MCW6037607.1 alpha/beta fold hydrolase [Spirulina subsalsa FACHB-351]